MKLTDQERIILINQNRILALLDEDNADDYQKVITVLEKGLVTEYEEVLYLEPPMSETDCREVLDILTMFNALYYSYDRLEDKGGIDELKVRFIGFEGNNEGRQLGYARYLIEQDDHYTHLVDGKDLDSHGPVIDGYREMLDRYKALGEPRLLTREQLLEVVG
jgi:uncharacterized protein YfbU (UPF0304 family)